MLFTIFQKRVWLVGIKSLLSVPNGDCFAFSDTTQPKQTHSVIRALECPDSVFLLCHPA